MKGFIIPVAAAIIIGVLVVWVPYGHLALPVFIILPILYILRYAFSADFRNSESSAAQFNFFMVFWIVIGAYHIRPVGLEKQLQPIREQHISVGSVIDLIESKTDNMVINCDPELIGKEVSINTITRIKVSELLDIIAQKTNAEYSYTVDSVGRSMAMGPHISVKIVPRDDSADSSAKSFIYDGRQ